jgi:hypothetical protein
MGKVKRLSESFTVQRLCESKQKQKSLSMSPPSSYDLESRCTVNDSESRFTLDDLERHRTKIKGDSFIIYYVDFLVVKLASI